MSGAGFDNLKALIVEDNGHMRSLLRALLNSVGIKHVAEAAHGHAAIDALRERKPDLVLTDMAMKPMDGIEFTRYVRNHEYSPNPFVPIIMISGHTERYRVEAARDAGVTEFLAKPITARNLFSRIAEIVERPRAFVRCDSYFGPDRRRRQVEDYPGPWRRKEDFQGVEVRL
ncbi:MAG TPA: response regulator [Rhizomicrobium sp.]|nr:response regulator [Rhizomicrobium sp.]